MLAQHETLWRFGGVFWEGVRKAKVDMLGRGGLLRRKRSTRPKGTRAAYEPQRWPSMRHLSGRAKGAARRRRRAEKRLSERLFLDSPFLLCPLKVCS